MAGEMMNVYASRENDSVAMQKAVKEFPAAVQDLIGKGEIIWIFLDASGKIVAEDNWGDVHEC